MLSFLIHKIALLFWAITYNYSDKELAQENTFLKEKIDLIKKISTNSFSKNY